MMNRRALLAAAAVLGSSLVLAQNPNPPFQVVINQLARKGDFAEASRLLAAYKGQNGITPTYIEAYSWLGRGHVMRNEFGPAVENAGEVRKLVADELKKRKLDAETHLPIALGAAIEVEALSAAGQHQTDQAVVLLNDEIKRWADVVKSSGAKLD